MRPLLTALALATASAGLVGLSPSPASAAPPPRPDGQCTTVTTTVQTVTCTFSYTGGSQYWTVPPMVTSATFKVVGAAGGAGVGPGSAAGGLGGGVQKVGFAVTPLTKLQINVGGKGVPYAPGVTSGWNGGGDSYGGGGGGASDVRYTPYSLAARALVGGGGGGGGTAEWNSPGTPGSGGNGGGAGGLAGPPSAGAGSGGSNGSNSPTIAGGGGPGSYTPGGGGGASGGLDTTWGACNWQWSHAVSGQNGSSTKGGGGGLVVNTSNEPCTAAGGFGGGGGGGYSPGGGGGGGINAGAGGGGGSGYGPSGSTNLLGSAGSHGVVQVSYTLPANWKRVGGATMGAAPTVIKRPGTAIEDVFFIDSNNHGVHRTLTNGVPTAEESIDGVFIPGSTIAAVATSATRIDVFGRGTDNALWQRTWNGTGWEGWHAISAAGALTSSPTAMSSGPGHVAVMAGGKSDSSGNWLLLFNSFDGGATFAQGQSQRTPFNLIGDPAMISTPGMITVFASYSGASGTGLAVSSYEQFEGWRSWSTRPTSGVTSGPAVSSYDGSPISVAWQSGSNLASTTFNPNGTWGSDVDRGPSYSPASSKVALSPLGDGYNKAFIRGTDNVLYSYSFG